MGDDAEYQMELNAEAAREAQIAAMSARSSTSRPMYVLVDAEFEELWEWSSPIRVPDVFAQAHSSGIGLKCFQTSSLPDEAPGSACVDSFAVDSDGEFEVLTLTQQDVDALRRHASQLGAVNRPLRERVLAGAFEAMVDHVNDNPGLDVYVFVRTV